MHQANLSLRASTTTRGFSWSHGTQLNSATANDRKPLPCASKRGVVARSTANFNIATLMRVDRSHRKFRKEYQQIGLQKLLEDLHLDWFHFHFVWKLKKSFISNCYSFKYTCDCFLTMSITWLSKKVN